jgi:hypothetical protein
MLPTSDTTPAAPKKRGKGKRARGRANGGANGGSIASSQVLPSLIPPFAAGSIEIEVPQEDPQSQEVADGVSVNPVTGAVTIESEDGSVTVDPTGASLWQKPEDGDERHDENLALRIDPIELARIAEELLDAIAADKRDRAQWEQMRAKAIEMLGLKLEDPKPDVSGSASGPATSMVRDPILLEAVERFRANAYAELCPARGPVKVVNWGSETAATDDLARGLQKDLNYYLTTIASEYYPDTNYMLWWTGLASGTFKKVYKCPLRRRPVSEYVDGTHLIVPSNATDLKNAGRVTHEISMRRAVMKRMQILGVYRDLNLAEPMPATPGVVDAKKAAIEGKVAQPQRPEDQDYTVYESYCELDIKGFEHTQKGPRGQAKATGLPLPYRVAIDEGSRQILEIRRNWEEDDEDFTADIPIVLFPYSMGLSRIYGSGLGQMGGNMAAALTALLRISIDNGMFANFPGFLYSEDMGGGAAGRQMDNHFRVPPGGGAGIKTGGMPIGNVVMGLPYKDISQAVVALIEQTRGVGQRLLGTGEIPVGEGRQDAPVGTTLALIEQATKILAGVHKMLHTAQSEEFRLLLKLFRADPDALWRGNRRPALGVDKVERVAKFKQALDEYLIVPMADPNVPSEMHRILKAMAVKQLTMGNPKYDDIAVDRRVAQVLQIDDFDTLLAKAPMQPPPEAQAAMAALQIEAKKVAIKEGELGIRKLQAILKAVSDDKDRKSRESIEAVRIAAQAAAAQDSSDAAAAGSAAGDAVDPVRLAQQAADVQNKARKLDLDEVRTLMDAHNRHADRKARQSEKAMDIAARLATHPDSNAIVDEQLQQMAPFLQPQGEGTGMGAGGSVGGGSGHGAEADGSDPDADDIADTLQLAMKIAAALREVERPPLPPGAGFVHPMGIAGFAGQPGALQ